MPQAPQQQRNDQGPEQHPQQLSGGGQPGKRVCFLVATVLKQPTQQTIEPAIFRVIGFGHNAALIPSLPLLLNMHGHKLVSGHYANGLLLGLLVLLCCSVRVVMASLAGLCIGRNKKQDWQKKQEQQSRAAVSTMAFSLR